MNLVTSDSIKRLLFVTALLLLVPTACTAAETISSANTWYPFIKQGKWGFIDATGAWKIPPKFDACYDLFASDMVRVWSKDRWGYINRKGAWITKPEFTEPTNDFESSGCMVVACGQKYGILDRRGHIILPVKYDSIVLSSDRAWVRSGDKLGVFGFNGKWINKLKTTWPRNYGMPTPLNEDRASWFQENPDTGKWGLIDATGQILFAPQFDAHIMGRHEDEGWNGPEGSGFENGQAQIYKDGKPLTATLDGKILPPQRRDYVSKEAWTPSLTLFHTMKGDELRTKDGKTVFSTLSIGQLHEGMAIFRSFDPTWGFINDQGQVIVPAGIYFELHDFTHGLAAAARQGGNLGFPNNRCAGFLDRTGHEKIPFIYWVTAPFLDGKASVTAVLRDEHGKATGLAPGFIDNTGKLVMSEEAKFDSIAPFCRGRSWALKHGDGRHYAMIDASEKVLTDFCYELPEYDSRFDNPPKPLESIRWVGDFAILKSGGKLGLATADGKVLFDPQFSGVGPLRDGMIRVTKGYGHVGYLNDDGQLIVPPDYLDGTCFDHGVAWITVGSVEANGGGHVDGYNLINSQGKRLLKDLCQRLDFIQLPEDALENTLEISGGVPPVINGTLICIAGKDDFIPWTKPNSYRLSRMSWGYVDLSGHIVAWYKPDKIYSTSTP